MKAIVLAVFATALAASAAAQDRIPIGLTPGQAITLQLDRDGATLARSDVGEAEWTPFDLAVARYLAGITPPKEPAPAIALPNDNAMPPAPAVQPDRLRLRFLSIAGQHSLLILENGYDRALVFRALITRDGTTRPTDVCLVMPHRHGFEHWPFPVARIEVSDLHFVPWQEGDPVPCA